MLSNIQKFERRCEKEFNHTLSDIVDNASESELIKFILFCRDEARFVACDGGDDASFYAVEAAQHFLSLSIRIGRRIGVQRFLDLVRVVQEVEKTRPSARQIIINAISGE